jgi:hypothetical protein
MEVLREQCIFIDTQRSAQDPSDMTVSFPMGMVSCAEDQQLRLSCKSFSCFFSFDNVTADNNAFAVQINNPDVFPPVYTEVVIPPGTYRFKDIAEAINSQVQNMTVSFVPEKNAFSFDSKYLISLYWRVPGAHKLFGFASADDILGISHIQSDQTIDMTPYSNIEIDLDNSLDCLPRMSLKNDASGMMTNSFTLVSVPIHVQPYSWLTRDFMNPPHVYLSGKSIHQLRLVARAFDKSNDVIQGLQHYKIVLSVETLSRNDRLKSIEKVLRDQLTFMQADYVSKHSIDDTDARYVFS